MPLKHFFLWADDIEYTSRIVLGGEGAYFVPESVALHDTTALEDFRKAKWTTALLGADVKARYADLKQAAADRCPRQLGTFVKAPEVQYHHDVYNQFLWNLF